MQTFDARFIPFFSDADLSDPHAFGKCGEDVFWKIVNNALYIEGKGDMWDFFAGELEEEAHKRPEFGTFNRVIIGEGVTSVGKFTFFNESIDEITLPESLKTIKSYAFFNSSIKKIDLTDNIENLEKCIFGGDSLVKELTVSVNIKNIAPSAFFIRYDSPEKIILTGTLPHDLSHIVNSCLFDLNSSSDIYYPFEWDDENEKFFFKLKKQMEKGVVSGGGTFTVTKDEDYYFELRSALHFLK